VSFGLRTSFGRHCRLAVEREKLRPEFSPQFDPVIVRRFRVINIIPESWRNWLKNKYWYWWNHKVLGEKMIGMGVYSEQGIQLVDYDEGAGIYLNHECIVTDCRIYNNQEEG